MTEPASDQHLYAPPQSDLGVGGGDPSPRLRFWLASVWSLVFAPVLFYGLLWLQAPALAFPLVALAAWLVPLIWVLAAHVQLSGGRISAGRTTIVAAGLTLAMGIAALVGVGAVASVLFDRGFD